MKASEQRMLELFGVVAFFGFYVMCEMEGRRVVAGGVSTRRSGPG